MKKDFKERLGDYESKQKAKSDAIKLEPSKWKRFWKRVWFLISWPFVYIWTQLHDWRFAIIFLVVCAVVSCEVWVPLALSLFAPPIGWDASMWQDLWTAITTHAIPEGNGTFKSSMFVMGIVIWGVWWLPGTPFLPLCIAITMGIKKLVDRHKEKKTHDTGE